jgi:hypothetical protein
MRTLSLSLFVGLMAVACAPASPPTEGTGSTEATGAAAEGTSAEGTAAEATGAPAEATGVPAEATGAPAEATGAPAADGTGAAVPAEADTLAGGTFSSPRFNIRFSTGDRWTQVAAGDAGGPAGLGTSADSVTLVHTAEPSLRLVIGNSDSIQLVDASFANLTEDIGFENVRIVPDRSQQRAFNGIPGYRTEADAHLRGDPEPVYLIAQALDLPGKPTMITMFITASKYYEFSDEMKALLDSVEALNLRPE